MELLLSVFFFVCFSHDAVRNLNLSIHSNFSICYITYDGCFRVMTADITTYPLSDADSQSTKLMMEALEMLLLTLNRSSGKMSLIHSSLNPAFSIVCAAVCLLLHSPSSVLPLSGLPLWKLEQGHLSFFPFALQSFPASLNLQRKPSSLCRPATV